MVSGNEQVVHPFFFKSIPVVKEAFLPLEVGIKKDQKHYCWGVTTQLIHEGGQFEICAAKNKVIGDERKKEGFSIKVNLNAFPSLGVFSKKSRNGNCSGEVLFSRGLKEDDGSCQNYLHLAVHWSLLVNGFLQALPASVESVWRKRLLHQKMDDEEDKLSSSCMKKLTVSCEANKQNGCKSQFVRSIGEKGLRVKEGNHISIECLLIQGFDKLSQTLQNLLDQGVLGNNQSLLGHKVHVDGFLRNLQFAKVGGVPSSVVGLSPSTKEEGGDSGTIENHREDSLGSFPQKASTNILGIPLRSVDSIKSTFSSVSSTELAELLPQVGQESAEHPDKKKLFSVQEFFRYTEAEGRRFFEELDRDGDGKVTVEDLKFAMRKRKLPQRYAHEFMRRSRNHLFSKSFGWKQFLSLMEQKEPAILRAYTSLCLSESGTLKKSGIQESLKNAMLPANEDNAVAMMRCLNADTEGSISYGQFRNFMLLLPFDRLQEDLRSIWFEAATVVVVPQPVGVPAGSILRSALASGLSCSFSCAIMHPIDTIKTRVQASTLSFPEITSKIPEIGVRGVYKGLIPAILGQFTSHGLRTGLYEASKMLLKNVAPTLPEAQVQSVLAFCGTVLGTTLRIPSEVLKQRMQAGLYDNLGEAFVGTWRHDGLGGFFRGTGATLCREVPFYVAGMGLYDESKKVVRRLLGRELEPWETVVIGAISGGLASVTTTPFDVIKTRMMTTQGQSLSMTFVAFSILRQEGPLGLFRGAVPRFFWIAPLGAMNFAGYELVRKALDKLSQKIDSSTE